MIKFIYTIFLAILVVLFVGLGIDTFYPGPQMPDYPVELEVEKPTIETGEDKLKEVREDYTKNKTEFRKESKTYNRNVSIISLAVAIIILILSLTYIAKIKIIADGILLGGVLTSVYSIIRGLMSENSQFRFIIVTIGLIIALVLGYIKFIKSNSE